MLDLVTFFEKSVRLIETGCSSNVEGEKVLYCCNLIDCCWTLEKAKCFFDSIHLFIFSLSWKNQCRFILEVYPIVERLKSYLV